jgi:hypothetical protein
MRWHEDVAFAIVLGCGSSKWIEMCLVQLVGEEEEKVRARVVRLLAKIPMMSHETVVKLVKMMADLFREKARSESVLWLS